MRPADTPYARTDHPFYITGGNVPPDALSYVTRDADGRLLNCLLAGEFSYILTSRQMGKSSLMTHMVKRLREHYVTPVVLDLSSQGFLLNAQQWYNGLIDQLGRRLRLEDEMEEFCRRYSDLSPLQRWQKALRDVALHRIDTQIVIFIDEIDMVRSLPFSADEFFAAIRACYNARTEDAAFQRLAFCLLGVATPADLIVNPRLTPFNIGTRIDLEDFTREEVRALEPGLGPSATANRLLMDRIYHWTSGHPYLTQRLCQAVAATGTEQTSASVDSCAERLFLSTKAQRQDSNLLFVQQRMLSNSEQTNTGMLNVYDRTLRGKRVPDSDTTPYISELKLAGIVTAIQGRLQVRNQIYRQVFNRAWIEENLPGAELRRLRDAYRRGVLRALAIAGLIFFAMAALAALAFQQRNEALHNASEAKNARNLAVTNAELALERLYFANMVLIQREWETGNTGHIAELMDEISTYPHKGFEWGYWQRLIHLDEQTLRIPTSSVPIVAFSPDGKRVAIASETAQIWDVTRHRTVSLQIPLKRVKAVAFSPDGRYLVTGSERTATVWNASTGEQVQILRGHTDKVQCVAYSPNGTLIATGANDASARVWDVRTGRTVHLLNSASRVCTVDFSPDGATLATGQDDGSVQLWDLRVARSREIFRGHQGQVSSVRFSPDGRYLVSCGIDRTARIWNVHTGTTTRFLKGHTDWINAVACSRDGKTIVTGSADGTAKVWDAASGREIRTLKGHTRSIQSVAISSDGFHIVTGSWDKTAKLWDLRTAQERVVLHSHAVLVDAAAFSPDSKWLVTGSGTNPAFPSVVPNLTTTVWNVETGRPWLPLTGYKQLVNSVAFSPNGNLIAAGGRDRTVQIWAFPTGKKLHTLLGHADTTTISFSPDGKQIATGSGDATARIWDTSTGTLQFILRGHRRSGVNVAFSPNGRQIITAGYGPTIQIWDSNGRNVIGTIDRYDDPILTLAFSPDGTRIVTGGYGNIARVWDVAHKTEILTLLGHIGVINSVAFSPDGTRIATASRDHKLILWDAVTGREVLRQSFPGEVTAVAFSPNGRYLATTADASIFILHADVNK